MKRIIAFAAAILVCCGMAQAIIVQKVYLKNGTVLSGYIQKQDSKGNLTFHTDRASMTLKSQDASITNERNYGVKELNPAWVKWAEQHDEFEGVGDSRTLLLADVTTPHKTVTRVKIQERGTVVKYLEMTPNTYVVAWKDVEAIKGERRSKTALSGFNRIYQLKNGQEFEGQYAEENDSTLTLLLDNGVRQSFRIDDVVKYTFRPINRNQDIFEQAELLDVVRSRNGSETRGIIIEQNYTGSKDSENYFLVQTETGTIQSIKLSDIEETRKEENPRYDPQYDILLKVGDVVINRQEVAAVGVSEDKDRDNLLLSGINRKVVLPWKEGETNRIIVEHRNANSLNIETYKLVRVTKTATRRDTVYSFSYRDLVNTVTPPVKIETSVNGTTKAEYLVSGNGIFALYDSSNKKAIPFIIEQQQQKKK